VAGGDRAGKDRALRRGGAGHRRGGLRQDQRGEAVDLAGVLDPRAAHRGLALRKGADRRPSAITLEGAIHGRLPERSLLDILARTDEPEDYCSPDQAERERTWALASARAGGISIRTLAAAIGLSPSWMHQLVAEADLDTVTAALGELRTVGWPAPEDPDSGRT